MFKVNSKSLTSDIYRSLVLIQIQIDTINKKLNK